MRRYSQITSAFWTGNTGRAIRGDHDAQIVAMYLLTSPHATLEGVYVCPLAYIAHDTGSPLEGASKGLQRLIDAGFCTYDEDSETVWVHEMAWFQIGEIKKGDKRLRYIQKFFDDLPESLIKQGFYERYKDIFALENKPLPSPLEAPSKPLPRGSRACTPVNREPVNREPKNPPLASLVPPNLPPGAVAPPAVASPSAPPHDNPGKLPKNPRATRLPDDWALPKAWGEWALAEKRGFSPENVREEAEKFGDYWRAKPGMNAQKLDWFATWRNWIRNSTPTPPNGKHIGFDPMRGAI